MADNVFINGLAAVHAGSAGMSVAFPDVCLCPPSPPAGPVPTPLVNTATAADVAGCAVTVTIEGNPVAHAQSYIAKSTGDEVAASTGGGIISHTTQGKAYFQTYSRNVMIEGQPAVRHLDLVTNNHMAKMPGNTPPVPWMSAMLPAAGPGPKRVEKVVGRKRDWIELMVIDQDEHPAFRVRYSVTLPDGRKMEGRLSFGGSIKLIGMEKGLCTVELHTAPTNSPQPKPKNPQARPYEDTPMKLETGKTHLIQVTLPRVLRVDLPFDPNDDKYAKHCFILRSKDGAYESKRTVADDAIAGDRKLTLEFTDLLPDKDYTLTHYDGQKTIGIFFADRTYEQLFPPPGRKQVRPKYRPSESAPPGRFVHRRSLKSSREDQLLPWDPNEPEDGSSAGGPGDTK